MEHRFVGQQVKLKETPGKVGDFEYISYSLDDPEMVKTIKEEFGDSTRIFPPGTLGTADWDEFRINVYIDETGIITEISKG